MRNIAVMTGRAGAGKTTVAMYLAQECGWVRVRFAEKLKAMARALGLNDDEIEGHLKEVPCSKLTLTKVLHVLSGNLPFVFYALLGEEALDPGDGTKPLEVLGGKNLVYAIKSFLSVVYECAAKAEPEGATPRSLMQMIGTDWGRRMIREDLWIDLWRREIAKTPEDATIVIDDCRFPNEHAECLAQGDTTIFRITRNTASALAGEIEKNHESEAYQLEYDYLVENNDRKSDAGERVRQLLWAHNVEKANRLKAL
jgi:hypothetical protein